jgi:hypothetical protein
MKNDIDSRYARLARAILGADKPENEEQELKAQEDAAKVVNAPSLAELLAKSAAKAKGKLVRHTDHTASEVE